MNVTLSIDKKVLERARELARRRGTTLNQIIRDHLAELTAQEGPEAVVRELERLWDEAPGDSGGWEWNRDELHDRPVLR